MRLPTLSTAWNTLTRSTQRSGFRKIEEPQRRDARSTELRYLTPGPYQTSFDHSKSLDIRTSIETTKSRRQFYPEKWYAHGWRFGAINCAVSVIVVFVINLIVIIWGTTRKSTGEEAIFRDDCHKVSRLNSALHFLINFLSTILLSSSNYCMQCLSAPTRKEIDRAHARGVWLDIGIPSVRNLRYISKRRVLIWALLGLSSLPLHLFYNSMVFSSIASHDYYAFSVSQSFTDDTDCLNCDKIADFSYRQIIQSMHQKVRNGELDRLEAADCISQYSTMIQSFRRNLLLVAANDKFPAKSDFPPFNDTNVYYASEFDSEYATSSSQSIDAYAWICAAEKIDYSLYRGSCANVANQIKADAKNWRIYKYPVEYCLSEKAPPMCKLHILLPIGYLVTFLNLFKAVLILYTVFYVKDNPLMTMGDAVASFMEDRDPTTKDLCLLTMHDLKQHRDFFPAGPREWSGQKYRWKDVTSRTRRTVTLIMFVIAIGTVSGLLDMGIRALRDNSFSVSLPDLARMGFGAIDPRTIIVWDISSTMSNILIANIAQPLLSFLYFSYNGLFTCMLLGFEWSRYAYKRRGLRVSRARAGAQRSTYFLQLPYRFSLPLMVLSGVLHWLVSQSIFLVAIDLYYPSGESRDVDTMNGSATGGFKSCGYSPIAIVSVVVLAAIMVIAAIGFGYVPYKPGMPLAGSCSAAISAACHNEEWDEVDGAVAARERLKWGVVGVGPDGVGHCALSTKGVTFPEKGKMYA